MKCLTQRILIHSFFVEFLMNCCWNFADFLLNFCHTGSNNELSLMIPISLGPIFIDHFWFVRHVFKVYFLLVTLPQCYVSVVFENNNQLWFLHLISCTIIHLLECNALRWSLGGNCVDVCVTSVKLGRNCEVEELRNTDKIYKL